MSALLAIVLFAAPTPPERAHFLRAQELFGQEKYRQALAEFSAANETSPREIPELYFNIAQCHRNLGQPRQAAAALERYLTLKPDAGDRREVRALIARLRVTPPPSPSMDRAEPDPAPPEAPPPSAPPPSASAPPPVETPAVEPPPEAPVALPAPVLAPPPPETTPPPRKSRKTLWIAIGVAGAVVAAGLGLGLGLGLNSSHSAAMPSSAPMLGSAATFDTRHH